MYSGKSHTFLFSGFNVLTVVIHALKYIIKRGVRKVVSWDIAVMLRCPYMRRMLYCTMSRNQKDYVLSIICSTTTLNCVVYIYLNPDKTPTPLTLKVPAPYIHVYGTRQWLWFVSWCPGAYTMVVIVPEDVLAPNGARPPAGTMIGSGDGFLPDSNRHYRNHCWLIIREVLFDFHMRILS